MRILTPRTAAHATTKTSEREIAMPLQHGHPQFVIDALTKLTRHFDVREMPCSTCPWRRDVQVSIRPDILERLGQCAEAGYGQVFPCQSQVGVVCTGYLLSPDSEKNYKVRSASASKLYDHDKLHSPWPLYATFSEMAAARGGVMCRCGWNGAAVHLCHRCQLRPGSPKFYAPDSKFALSGTDMRFSVIKTWACEECWVSFKHEIGED